MVTLADQVILVTGAGQGLGRGIACAVAEAGARVLASDLDLAAAEDTAKLIREAGHHALGGCLDVTRHNQVEASIQAAVDHFGRLDGLVANAGVIRLTSVLEASPGDHALQFQVNVEGLLSCCQLAARQMIEQGDGGSIVNVASNAGKVGYPNMASYNASKSAVISLTRSLAAEWAEHQINVNAVCPGGVNTPMLREVADWLAPRIDGDRDELLASMVPAQLGRHVEPIEVGRVVAFLLSDQALIIRGQAINVDGGDTPY